jgi:signal transduction histidine kinase
VRELSHAPGISSLKDDLPQAFGEDRTGHVWVGFNSGVARYQAGSFTFFTAKDGVPPGTIVGIHLDHAGRLWLASARGGLGRVDDPGARQPSFSRYTIAQGLSSNSTSVLTEDRHGNIYVGGGRGLDRLDPATGRVKHFTTADGLPPGLFHAAFRDHTGVLWFGTSSGLARLAPTPDTPSAPPPVMINGLRIRGLPKAISALGEQALSLPDLTAVQNQLQIDFVGLSFGSGDVLHYQYRLDGAETEWTAPSEQRSVTYASLSPGRYVFNVRAVNSDGIVSAHPAAMSFTILRPMWQRWWFLTLAGVAIGLTGYGLYQFRVARLLQIAEMRTRIATDLHDDIGANLTRIALLSEVTAPADVDVRDAASPVTEAAIDAGVETAPLASIGRIARESVGSMNDIVWAINPARETLLDLTRRMRQHANEVFTLRDIELRFSAPPGGEHLKLGVDVRRDVLLVYKEAVNNAARHSRCSRVEIDFRVERARLRLVVADNGSGFDPSLESEGQGLRSMTRRARRLRGTLETESAAGAGTTVRLSIPL